MKESNTGFVGKVLLHFAKLPSTNTFALELLAKSAPIEGTAISTRDQHQGRGQIGSSWESAPGQNLTVSFILYPSFLPPNRQFLLSKAIGLAARDLIAAHLPQAKVYLKWPNDLIVNERKIGGILLQNAIQGNRLQHAVAGIGLNINQEQFMPYTPEATSLFLESGKQQNLDLLFDELCAHIEVYYLALKAGNSLYIDQMYLKHLFLLDQSASFQRAANMEIFQGYIRGVTENGHLMVEHDGRTETFDLKEIRLITQTSNNQIIS